MTAISFSFRKEQAKSYYTHHAKPTLSSMSALELRFIRRFLPPLMIALIAAGMACIWINQRQQMHSEVAYAQRLIAVCATTLEKIPDDKRDAIARTLIENLSQDPAIEAVRLTNRRTRESIEAGAFDTVHPGGGILRQDVVTAGSPTAPPLDLKLEVQLRPPSFASVAVETISQLALLLVVSGVSVALGIAIHRHLISRPLSAFRKVIDAHESGTSLPAWEETPPPDELGSAMRAYESLSRRRVEAEKQLIVSQDRLKILSDNLPNSFLYQNRVEPDGKITFSFVGDSVRELFGVTPEEVYRDPGLLRNRVDPDYAAEMSQAEEKAVRMRAEFAYECPFIFPDGTRHWVQFLSRPSQMPDGEYLWQGVFIDVTEAREKDAALQQSRADARAILDALPDPIFVNPWPTRTGGAHFTHINQSACDFLGMTQEELLSVGPGEVDEIAHDELQRIRTALQKDGRLRFETTFIRKDGRRFPGELCSCIIEFGGRTVSISVARSLEEQKQREAQLRDAAAQIETDRTIIAQKNTDLSQLLHILCHDLANPISVLNGMLHLREKNPQSDISECAEISQQVLDLIGQVHKLQGLEASQQSLALQNVSVEPLIDQALRTIQPRLEAKQLHVEKDLSPGQTIRVEPTSFLNSVLANILTNAIKFSLPGSTIQIRSRTENEKTIIEIQDHGIGIPPEILPHLFLPTARTTRPGTAGEIGTGFGMPLVQKFMTLYQGEIQITSTPLQPDSTNHPPDHGTIVQLILPSTPSLVQ